MRTRGPAPTTGRSGYTLIEVMIVLMLLGAVTGTLMTVINRQQRFYRGANDIMDTRSQLRQAAELLPAELRGISSVGGDITAMNDSALTFYANTGSAVVCKIASTTELVVPPTNLSKHTLTAWLSKPEVGDNMFVFDEGIAKGAEDDTWKTYTIASINDDDLDCLGPPYTDALLDVVGAGLTVKHRYKIAIAGGATLSPNIKVGSVVRFARKVSYKLYQSPTDNLWYLGYSQFKAGAWDPVQPVSGSYRAYANGGASGLTFKYYDRGGNQITALPTAVGLTEWTDTVARVDITMRGQGTDPSNVLMRGQQYLDSLALRVAIRNRQ